MEVGDGRCLCTTSCDSKHSFLSIVSFCMFVSFVSGCYGVLAYVSMGLMYCFYTRVKSSLIWPNFVLASGWMTLRRVLALLFMLSVCSMNDILLSYVTPSVVAVLA